MNRFVVLIFLFFVSSCSTISNSKNSLIAEDKLKHFGVSVVLSYGFSEQQKQNGALNCDAFKRGFSYSMSIGFAKEIYDDTKKNNHFDFYDLLADFLGSATGSLLSSNCN